MVLVILSSPLLVYYKLTYSIYEAKSSIELKEIARSIVKQMDGFSSKDDGYFVFPRFSSYQAGLFAENNMEIFSLLSNPIRSFEYGSHIENGIHYYVFELPKGRYFGASKLIVSKRYDNYEILRQIFTISLSIVVIIYLLSWLILYGFSKPFNRLNQFLDEFIKDSMHEIKTPLTIINTSADLFLSKHSANKEIRNIKAAVKTLATVYDDMEYLVREERVEHAKNSVDFSRFLSERVSYFCDIAALKDIEIRSYIEKDIYLYFSDIELQRLIDNNLSNAIKYSFEGGKIVVMLILRGDRIYLRFRDQGVGIADTTKIFNRYVREDGLKGGFGVGLAIVKRIADSSNVGIDLKSTVGIGTRFTYIFNAPLQP